MERAAGAALPGALLMPSGLAVVVLVGSFATATAATAKVAAPAAVALALAGFALTARRRDPRLDWYAAGAAIATFGAYAAPIALSGAATFAGYITLDDTATWLAITDQIMDRGRDLGGLAPSTHQVVLNDTLTGGYPTGAFLPLGLGQLLLDEDGAWLFQPVIAFYAAMLALALYALLARLARSRPLRAFGAFVASQPALLYAYAFWSGIKEVAAAFLIASVAGAAAWTLQRRTLRTLLPVATASAALLAVLTVGGAVWLTPVVVAAVAAARRLSLRAAAVRTAAFAALVLALSIPSIAIAGVFIRNATASGWLTSQADLGNLIEPLNTLQVFGIWPSGDLRLDPDRLAQTYVLIAVVAIAGVAGVVFTWRRRAWGALLYVAAAAVGCLAVVSRGSPWLDAKGLATASPAAVLAAVGGAAWLAQHGRRVEAAVLAAAVGGGVLASNVLTYQNVWLAPRNQLVELETIGERFAGDGPALMTEYHVYGARHLLRKLDAEGAAERRARPVLLRDGQTLPKGSYADLDEFDLQAILVYRTLVLHRSPAESRPPSAYGLAWRGRYYDVWQRDMLPATQVLQHLSLGSVLYPAGRPACSDIRRLGQVARAAGGRLVAVPRRQPMVVPLAPAAHPPGWPENDQNTSLLTPTSSGTVTARLRLPADGRYEAWLGGSFRGRVEVAADGRTMGSRRHQLNSFGQYTTLGEARLSAGAHTLTLRYVKSELRPGGAGAPFPIGPLVITRSPDRLRLEYVAPERATTLCTRTLDWVEAVGPS